MSDVERTAALDPRAALAMKIAWGVATPADVERMRALETEDAAAA